MSGRRPLLVVDNLVAGYEPGLPIVNGASISVAAGEIVAILGPNGAGKSTLIKAIAGLVPISGGSVTFAGRDITRMPAHRLIGAGLAFAPQTENVFGSLSVADNLKLAAGILPKPLRADRIAAAYETFPDLARQRALTAGRLSGGQRQMLAIARAMLVGPKALMLDEPSAGLSPKLVEMVFAKLADIRRERRRDPARRAERARGSGSRRPRHHPGAGPQPARGAGAGAGERSAHCGPLSRRRRNGSRPVTPQVLVDGLMSGSLIGLGAIGVTLTYSILRFANFAHGEFISFGAYATLLVASGISALIVGSDQGIGGLSISTAVIAASFVAMALTAGLALALDKILFSQVARQERRDLDRHGELRGLDGDPRLARIRLYLPAGVFFARSPDRQAYRLRSQGNARPDDAPRGRGGAPDRRARAAHRARRSAGRCGR